MKYKLTILERSQAMELLPTKGDIFLLRIVKDMKERIEVPLSEHKVAKIENVLDNQGKKTGQMKWDAKYTKKIDIEGKEASLIRDKLIELNSKNELSESHLSLYEKFVETKE